MFVPCPLAEAKRASVDLAGGLELDGKMGTEAALLDTAYSSSHSSDCIAVWGRDENTKDTLFKGFFVMTK